MAKVVYLTLEQVLAIHHDQIERYSGSHGIRDLKLLESAIHRPQSSFMGEDLYNSIFDKASALMHSILMNHPFLDGNKRTATVSTAAFLHLNGLEIKCSQKELINLALSVETKEKNLEQISVWLKDHSRAVI